MKSFNATKEQLTRDNISLSMVDISRVRNDIEKHGNSAYADHFTRWEKHYAESKKYIKRKSDFISGRLAAKRAVLDYINKNNGKTEWNKIQSNKIEIRRMDTGEPAVYINNRPTGLAISISHSGDAAVSGVTGSSEYKGIGIDIEKIEERDTSFIDLAFNKNEIEKLKEDTGCENPEQVSHLSENITRLWTIKESVLKSLGIGLNVDLKDIEVDNLQSGSIGITIKNDVRERYEKLRGKEIAVQSYKIDNYILSVSSLK